MKKDLTKGEDAKAGKEMKKSDQVQEDMNGQKSKNKEEKAGIYLSCQRPKNLIKFRAKNNYLNQTQSCT